MTALLSTARLYWQMGSWEKLAEMQVEVPQKGSMTRDYVELLLYRMQGLFVSGRIDEGRELAQALSLAGLSCHALGAALVSGAQSNIARAHLANGKSNRAKGSIAAAIAQNPGLGEAELVKRLRFESEQRCIAIRQPATSARLPYIDVIGPSGSGKTTLLQALAEKDGFTILAKPGPGQTKSSTASRMVIRFMLEHPDFVRTVATALKCSRDSERLNQFFERTLSTYVLVEPEAGTRHLFDEGFVCRANSLFAYTDGPLDEDAVREYLQSVPLPAALIVLRTPPDICLERLKSRPKGLPQRMCGLDDQECMEILRKMNRISEVAAEEMHLHSVIVTCPEGGEVAEMAQTVAAHIWKDQQNMRRHREEA